MAKIKKVSLKKQKQAPFFLKGTYFRVTIKKLLLSSIFLPKGITSMFDTILFIVALIVILFFIVQFVCKRKQTSNKKTSVEPMNYAEEDSNSYTSWSESASDHDGDGDADADGR
jgi:hypothetical protein